MTSRLLRVVKDDKGMSTAEYAVGTVGAAGLAGLLVKVLTSPDVQQLISTLIEKAFSWTW